MAVIVAIIVVIPRGSHVFIIISITIYNTLVLVSRAQVGTNLGLEFALVLGLPFMSTDLLQSTFDFAHWNVFLVNYNGNITIFPVLKL